MIKLEKENESYTCKICDFGLSRSFIKTTQMSEFAGTLPWMSPEIMKGEPVNKACDVWSYGVVLWELFTGEKPFSDLGWNQIYIKVATENQHLPIPNECPEI